MDRARLGHRQSYGGTLLPCGQDEVGDTRDEIWAACNRISETCEGLTESRSLRKAKSLRFVPD